MKDISLALGSLLQVQSEMPVQTNDQCEQGSLGKSMFILPDLELDAIGQLAQTAKNVAQNATHKMQQYEDRSAQMQMLLSPFLSQGAQPQPEWTIHPSISGETGSLLQALAQVQNRTARAAPRNGSLTPDVIPATIPPKMQAVLASVLVASPAQRPATPSQQAELARSAAQDLRAIVAQKNQERRGQSPVFKEDRRSASPVTAMDKPEGNETQIAGFLLNNALAKNASSVDNSRQPDTTFKLDPQRGDLGEQLTSLLKDRIQFQLDEQQQTSTIRLDPPSLGKLNISVQLDAGKLVVHIDASQADIRHSLTQFSDSLRQHLTEQNFVKVEVQVSSDGRSQQQSKQENQGNSQQRQIVSSVELESEGSNEKQNESVLVKV